MPSQQRKIIHVDMDCFYAAVEVREAPMLQGQPVAVGGAPDQRGVVAACNYEARAYGVHSAMPMSVAMRRCPALVQLPVRMELYRKVSAQIHAIFRDYTELIEPLSLDEAYLDVSGQDHCLGSASLMASEIRRRIFKRTGLTASAGVGPNKLIAKIASDWKKPDGQTVIPPQRVASFISPLPVEKLFGVGQATAGKMHAMGIYTCVDLQAIPLAQLQLRFGVFGARLYQLCRGIDERSVNTWRITKSLSIEDTYSVDLPDLRACLEAIEPLYEGLLRRYQGKKTRIREVARRAGRTPQLLVPKTLLLKMRFEDFVTTTAQQAGSAPNLQAYQQLCTRAYARGQRPVRLLGLGMMFDTGEE